MKTNLKKLAARVEALTGACWETDVAIARALGRFVGIRQYTASLDAAMTLVPADAFWQLGNDGDGPDPSDYRARVYVVTLDDAHRGIATAATPALALTAAALRALAAQDKGPTDD